MTVRDMAAKLCPTGRSLLTAAVEMSDPDRAITDARYGAEHFLEHANDCAVCATGGLTIDELDRAMRAWREEDV